MDNIMSGDYDKLREQINANIKKNGKREITGPVLNAVLNSAVDVMEKADEAAVVSETVRRITTLTQLEWDALEVKDGNTMYVIMEDTGDAAGQR